MDPNNISSGQKDHVAAEFVAGSMIQQQFGTTGVSTQDTISSADGVSGIAAGSSTTASLPMLDPQLVAFEMQSKMDEIVIKMLTSWGDALAAQAEQRARDLKDPNYLSQLADAQLQIKQAFIQQQIMVQAHQSPLASLDSLQPINFNDPAHLDLKQALADGLQGVGRSVDNGKVSSQDASMVLGSAMLMAAALVAGAGIGFSQSVTVNQPSLNLAVNPMTEAAQHFGAVIPPDMRAELGLVGAMFGLSAFTSASFPSVASAQTGQKPDERSLAQNYAKEVLKMVKGSSIDGFLASIFDKKGTLTEAQVIQQVAIQKVILMSTAVAALYIGVAGGVTGQELQNMINNPQLLNDPKMRFTDEEKELVPLIRKELAKLSPSQRARLEGAIGDYIDSKPKFESLLDLSKVLQGISERADFHNIAGPV